MQRRVFLADHMCILPYGHNFSLLDQFRRILEPSTDQIKILVPKALSEKSTLMQLDRVLNFPYIGYLPRPTVLDATGNTGNILHARLANFRDRLFRYIVRELGEIIQFDFFMSRTRMRWQHVITKYDIGMNDVIFFPSAEYYGVVSLIRLLLKQESNRRPHVHVRLIGVGENAEFAGSPSRPTMLAALREAHGKGVPLSVSAETPKYARYLSRLLPFEVAYLPHPPEDRLHPLKWSETKSVSSPGQGRHDKGFFRLFAIAKELHRISTKPYSFLFQNMRKSDPNYRVRYESMLRHLPNVSLFDAQLTKQEVDDIYSNSDIIVLPYDSETYALRGSAVFQEAIAVGRPVVCATGTAFAEQLVHYKNGLVADTDEQFALMIEQIASMPISRIHQMTFAARKSYVADFKAGMDKIIEGFPR